MQRVIVQVTMPSYVSQAGALLERSPMLQRHFLIEKHPLRTTRTSVVSNGLMEDAVAVKAVTALRESRALPHDENVLATLVNVHIVGTSRHHRRHAPEKRRRIASRRPTGAWPNA